MKNPKDTIGNRTRDFPICNEVPEQIGPPRAPNGVAGCTTLTLKAAVLGDTTACILVTMHRTFQQNLRLPSTQTRHDCAYENSAQYSMVSFCDDSFYDHSLLRPLSSRTEHSRLVVHHCRNSSVLSLLSALLALFRCAYASFISLSLSLSLSLSILVQFF